MPIQELLSQAKAVVGELAPSTAIAAAFAALICFFFSRPWGGTRSRRTAVGGVVGLVAGIFAGCWWLGVQPHWPPREDQDRFLLILLPAIIVIELIAAAFLSPEPGQEKTPAHQAVVWFLRFIVAAAAGRILLHDTSYVADLSGPGSRQWTIQQTWIILGGLSTALFGVWFLLDWFAEREPGRAMVLAVAMACAGTSVAMMMSGYASGGPLAMPLAGAVVGVLLASLILKGAVPVTGVLGIATVGLFGLLIIGHFFGELTWVNAGLIFFAPVCCVIPGLPVFRRWKPGLRGFLGIVLTIIPVAIALGLAQQKMMEDAAPPSSDSQEPTLDDYMNFGK
jgi:hypothetical protein